MKLQMFRLLEIVEKTLSKSILVFDDENEGEFHFSHALGGVIEDDSEEGAEQNRHQKAEKCRPTITEKKLKVAKDQGS